MLGLAFASVGAAGATAAGSPCAAVGGTVGGPAAILESVLGTAVGFGVAGLAEASVAGAGGTVLVEAVADALLDCVSAGATGALAAADRVRNTGMAGEPAWLPGAWPQSIAFAAPARWWHRHDSGLAKFLLRFSPYRLRAPTAGAAGTGAATAAVTGVALAAGAIAGATARPPPVPPAPP